MSDQSNDTEEQRAAVREELADDSELANEQATEEASFAPAGHLGERMNERERRRRS